MANSNAVSKTLSTLQSVYDLTKGIADLNEAHAIKSQIGELQAEIIAAQQSALSAQTDQFALLERVGDLEKQIADMETWNTEKEKYQLNKTDAGNLTYILKNVADSTEPEHELCADCYQHGQKSILQTLH